MTVGNVQMVMLNQATVVFQNKVKRGIAPFINYEPNDEILNALLYRRWSQWLL